MSVIIVSGSPGCGKTTLCRYLAGADAHGVHLETDVFFQFLAHKVDPSLPESKTQNETVVRAYCTAAKRYSEGGYCVYLDGVIGPWLLPLVTHLLPDCEFVLLHAPLELALHRVSQRLDQPSASAAVVRRMHRKFEAVLESCRAHVLLTENQAPEALAREIAARRASGGLALSNIGSRIC